MADFFKESDLVIIIDDDYCPKDKTLKFMCLNEDIIAKIANDLEMVDSEYADYSIEKIETLLKARKKDLKNYFKINEPEEFNHASVERFHPKDIPAESICKRIDENKAGRNFVVLDQFLDEKQSLELLKDYLEALHSKFVDCYIGIVFWSSKPSDIKTLEDAKNYLINDVQLPKAVAEELSLYVNFIDKNTADYSDDFEVAFRKSQNNNLISLFSKSFKTSVNSLKSKMWDINNNEELIHYDYLMEGMQLDDIFFEIYQANFKKIYNNYCMNDYERYINPIRKAVQKYEADIEKNGRILGERIFISRSIKELNNFMKNENSIQDCKKSDDIKFGDIFKIKDSYYMVVTQGCDLSIRMLGERKKDYIDLIQIEVSKEKPKNQRIQTILKNNYKRTNTESDYNGFLSKNLNVFANIGINSTDMTEILNDKNGQTLNITINEVKLHEGNVKLYSVESIFLDCTILSPVGNSLEVTNDSIKNSKEIRIATKIYIQDKFNKFIERYSDLDKEMLEKLSDPNKNRISSLVPFSFLFDVKNKLIGLSVKNDQISRIGRLDYIKAHEILKKFMNEYSRYEYSKPPLID